MVREVENGRKWFTPNNTWSIGWLRGRETHEEDGHEGVLR